MSTPVSAHSAFMSHTPGRPTTATGNGLQELLGGVAATDSDGAEPSDFATTLARATAASGTSSSTAAQQPPAQDRATSHEGRTMHHGDGAVPDGTPQPPRPVSNRPVDVPDFTTGTPVNGQTSADDGTETATTGPLRQTPATVDDTIDPIRSVPSVEPDDEDEFRSMAQVVPQQASGEQPSMPVPVSQPEPAVPDGSLPPSAPRQTPQLPPVPETDQSGQVMQPTGGAEGPEMKVAPETTASPVRVVSENPGTTATGIQTPAASDDVLPQSRPVTTTPASTEVPVPLQLASDPLRNATTSQGQQTTGPVPGETAPVVQRTATAGQPVDVQDAAAPRQGQLPATSGEPQPTEQPDPANTHPANTRPANARPVTPEPARTEPVVVQPVTAEPAAPRREVPQPASPEPALPEPGNSQPVSSQPISSQPGSSQPSNPQPGSSPTADVVVTDNPQRPTPGGPVTETSSDERAAVSAPVPESVASDAATRGRDGSVPLERNGTVVRTAQPSTGIPHTTASGHDPASVAPVASETRPDTGTGTGADDGAAREMTPTAGQGQVLPAVSATAMPSLQTGSGTTPVAADLTGSIDPAVQQHVTEQVVASVLERARIVQQEGQARMELQLSPPELGRMRIEISRSERGLKMRVAAESPATAMLLRSSLGEIQTRLESGEMPIDSMELFDSDPGGDSGASDRSSDESFDVSDIPRRYGQAGTGTREGGHVATRTGHVDVKA